MQLQPGAMQQHLQSLSGGARGVAAPTIRRCSHARVLPARALLGDLSGPTPTPASSGLPGAAPAQQQQFVQQPSGLLLPPSSNLALPGRAGGARPARAARHVSTPAAAPSVQTHTSDSQGTTPPAAAQPQQPQGRGASSAAAAAAQPATFSLPPADVILLPNGQRAHSLHDEGMRVIQSMSGWAEHTLMQYLKPVERSWQPQDFLPEPESPDFYDQVLAMRAAGQNLPFDYLVVLVGDMVTEEALPSYMNMLNLLDGTKDETGAQSHPWAVWTRHWTAEENRHGNLLNKYLYLSGRVNMKSIETTVQRLVGNGLDPQLENNPYLCFVYTSFQERATKISHANTGRLAAYYGDSQLAKICGIIAADEGRHELAYTAIVSEFFRRDPEGALLAFADMMRKGIVMPAHLLDDGCHSANNKGGNLFHDYAAVADNIGVYTTNDYADIVDHLVKKWGVAEMQGLSGGAAAAQEYVCGHAARIRRLANIQAERRLRDRKRGKTREASFDWIRGRHVALQ